MPKRLISLALALVLAPSAWAQGGMAGMGPGPRERDSATRAQMQVIHDLLANHSAISRSVTNLPNGIRTVTEANDPRLTFLIRQHVVTMVERVKTGAAFGCGVETPAVRALFQARDRIETRIEPTARGVALVQTSDDPAAVRALQQHAAEVSEMARNGLAARGEGMMRRRAMMGSELGCGVVTEEEETARQP